MSRNKHSLSFWTVFKYTGLSHMYPKNQQVAHKEITAYLTRLLNCPSKYPVDPATNTDGIVIPRLPAVDNSNRYKTILSIKNYH